MKNVGGLTVVKNLQTLTIAGKLPLLFALTNPCKLFCRPEGHYCLLWYKPGRIWALTAAEAFSSSDTLAETYNTISSYGNSMTCSDVKMPDCASMDG